MLVHYCMFMNVTKTNTKHPLTVLVQSTGALFNWTDCMHGKSTTVPRKPSHALYTHGYSLLIQTLAFVCTSHGHRRATSDHESITEQTQVLLIISLYNLNLRSSLIPWTEASHLASATVAGERLIIDHQPCIQRGRWPIYHQYLPLQ